MGYDAFLSYSHAADGKLAADLQSGLHGLARPWYSLRAVHVFRDKTSLSANPALWPAIEGALSQSEFFLLMASLGSARSPWVSREVGWWLEHRSPETLFIVITEGEVCWNDSVSDFDWSRTTCLPPNLRGKYSQEPLYVDLRWARAEPSLSLRQTQFRSAVLDIAAPLHHKSKDEIDGEDVRQHRRVKIASWTAGFLLFVLTIASVIGAVKAILNAREARKNAEIARANETLAKTNEELAKTNQHKAEAETEIATTQQHLAEERARIALSRQLAAETLNVLQSRQDLALLLGVEALQTDDTFEARHGLLTALEFRPQLLAFLQGHTRGVESKEFDDSHRILGLTLSADGTKMASTSWDRVITFWDMKTRRPIGQPIKPLKNWGELTINPDLTMLAVNASNGVLLWDIRSRTAVTLTNKTLDDGGTLAFSPDGKILATGSSDGILTLWDVAKRERIGEPLTSSNARGDPAKGEMVTVSPFSFVAFTPDGSKVEANANFWDVKTHQPVKLIVDERASRPIIGGVKGETMASIIGTGGGIVVWDARSGERTVIDEKMGDCCFDRMLTFSSDGKVMASGTQDGRIKVWDVSSRLMLLTTIRAHSGAINDLVFARDGRALASAGDDGTLALWDITVQHAPGRYIKLSQFARIGPATFSPDGRTLAASVDGAVRLWNPETLEPMGQPLSSRGAMSLAFSPDGRLLASGCSDDTVLLWDWRKGQTVGQPMQAALRRGRSLSAVAFNPDGTLLASGSQDSSVLLWNLRTRRETRFSESVKNIQPVSGLAFSPDSKLLMAGGSSSGMLWDIPAHHVARNLLEGQTYSSRSIALSPDGKIVAGSAAQGVILWDLATRRRIGTLLRPRSGLWEQDTMTSMAFSPSGNMLAATTRDGAILVWDVETRQQLGRSLHDATLGRVWEDGSVAFSPDGKFLAVTAAENLGPSPEAGGIFLWEASPESWKAHACRMANRKLTQDEWQQFMGNTPYHPVCGSPEAQKPNSHR